MGQLMKIGKYFLILAFIAVFAVAMMRQFGPKIGNTFSTISNCYALDCPTTPTTIVASTEITNPTPLSNSLSVEQQFAQIDQLLKQSTQSNIAYNVPTAVGLNNAVTIELLLNPSATPTQLGSQVTEGGEVVTATIEITPKMKAELIAQDKDALVIQPVHANAEQLIGSSDTTRWAWLVTGKKSGTQKLILVIYRLVKYEGQEYWREVETYRADINVEVTFSQWLQSLDWKWIVGVTVTALLIPAFWRWYDQRKKQAEQALKPKRQMKKSK